jgi:hypothetical protein
MRRITAIAVASIALLSVPASALAQMNQPHMQAALQDLYAAQQEVNQAEQYGDHGGFAARASNHINAAINAVQAGIAFRNANPY